MADETVVMPQPAADIFPAPGENWSTFFYYFGNDAGVSVKEILPAPGQSRQIQLRELTICRAMSGSNNVLVFYGDDAVKYIPLGDVPIFERFGQHPLYIQVGENKALKVSNSVASVWVVYGEYRIVKA